MGSLAKAYCHHNIPFHHYRPSNLQNPISLFAITSPWISPTHPHNNPNHKHPHFGGGAHFIIPTVAAAASAWFFLRLPPIITAPPIDFQQLELVEEGAIQELPLQLKPRYVKALHFYKTKPGTVLRLIDVYDSDDYDSLKARIRLSAGWLETARRELEELVDRDPARLMEYSQVVDELMDVLRDMDLYIDKCQKDKVNKSYLRSCNRLLARVRRMEAQILNVLKEFHGQDQH